MLLNFIAVPLHFCKNTFRQDGDDVSEGGSRADSEDEELRDKELELREAIRQSVSEIVAGGSVAGSLNLDEIEVISEEDMEGRGEV